MGVHAVPSALHLASNYFDSPQQDADIGGMEVALKFLMSEGYSRDLSREISSAKQEKAHHVERISMQSRLNRGVSLCVEEGECPECFAR